MKILRKIKGKLPVVVTLCCCLAVAGLSALVKGDGKAVEVSTGASQKQVVIIDAGHGGYVLNQLSEHTFCGEIWRYIKAVGEEGFLGWFGVCHIFNL